MGHRSLLTHLLRPLMAAIKPRGVPPKLLVIVQIVLALGAALALGSGR